jgi:hypothetical protein
METPAGWGPAKSDEQAQSEKPTIFSRPPRAPRGALSVSAPCPLRPAAPDALAGQVTPLCAAERLLVVARVQTINWDRGRSSPIVPSEKPRDTLLSRNLLHPVRREIVPGARHIQ